MGMPAWAELAIDIAKLAPQIKFKELLIATNEVSFSSQDRLCVYKGVCVCMYVYVCARVCGLYCPYKITPQRSQVIHNPSNVASHVQLMIPHVPWSERLEIFS